MKRLDDDNRERFLKIGITGESGGGKTWLGTTAPRPLFLIWERQAKAAIEASCSVGRAKGGQADLENPSKLERPMMILIESTGDLGNVLRALHSGAKNDRNEPLPIRSKDGKVLVTLPHFPETLVVDSLTDACAMLRDELLREAPPRKDADSGLPDESYNHRKVLNDRCTQLIRALRNAPCHVLFLALREEAKIYRARKEVGRQWRSQLPHKELHATFMAATNAFGTMYWRQGRCGVIFQGDDWMGTKSMPPLRRFEVPNVAEWIGRIFGTWTADPGDAPPESEDAEELGRLERAERAAAAAADTPEGERTEKTAAEVAGALDLPFSAEPEQQPSEDVEAQQSAGEEAQTPPDEPDAPQAESQSRTPPKGGKKRQARQQALEGSQ